MRKFFSLVCAPAAMLFPFAAAAEEPVWVGEPRGLYWNHFCGEEFPMEEPTPPNAECKVDGRLIGKSNEDGLIFMDAWFLTERWNMEKLPPVGIDILRDDEEPPSLLMFRSTLLTQEQYITVNKYEFADLCEAYSGKYVGDGFHPLLLRQAPEGEAPRYGPTCIVALGTTQSTFRILGGMLEDGTWYIDSVVLDALPQ